MSSLDAALYAYSLEESWDARLRKRKTGSVQQVLECRTLTRDTRDHLLYLIQEDLRPVLLVVAALRKFRADANDAPQDVLRE